MSFIVKGKWYVTQGKSLAFVESCYRQPETDAVLYKGHIIYGIGQTKCVWDETGIAYGNDLDSRLVDLIDNIEVYLLRHYHILAYNFKERGENLNKEIAIMREDVNKALNRSAIYDRLHLLEKACDIKYGNQTMHEMEEVIRLRKRPLWKKLLLIR